MYIVIYVRTLEEYFQTDHLYICTRDHDCFGNM